MIIYIVYPDSLKKVSMNSLAMSELLLNELILSKNQKIKFHVNNNLRLIECNDPKIKEILSLLLKSGKFEIVKKQVLDLLHKDARGSEILGNLKFIIGNKETYLTVQELKSGADFTWELNFNYAS